MHDEEEPPTTLIDRPAGRPSASLGESLLLRVLEGPDRGREARLDEGRTLSIGTAADNELRLVDPTVSRYHVELMPARGGARVVDLESLNGSFVGEVRIEAGIVPLGARLRVGATTLAVERAATPAPPRAPADEAPIAGLVGESDAMRKVRATVRRLAPSRVSVLLRGETGTGKEVVARALHALSDRARGPFVVVDCGSLPPTLVASELFGHEKGAFTGADRRHAGAFERAQGGTIFLDEIGELPLELQPALLGVLERHCFRRVGGGSDLDVDVRVISATHRDLRAAANTGAFRPDLYFRLAVARIALPPLRERREDVEPLVRHFAEELTGDPDAAPFDAATLRALAQQPWSGNARELRNVVESAIALGSLEVDSEAPTSSARAEGALRAYREARADAIHDFERVYLRALIEATEGNASEAARRAGMDRAYLLGLLRKHGLR